MALYAWSDIKAGTLEKPKAFARGEKVSKGDFPGMLDADWQAMLDAGVIRDRPFPAPEGYSGSALDYLRDQLADAQAVSSVDEEEAVVELAAVEREEPAAPQAPAPQEEKASPPKK